MVAYRALAPLSSLAMEEWVAKEVLIDGLLEVGVHQLYRAMDFLFEAQEEIQRRIYSSVVNLFNIPRISSSLTPQPTGSGTGRN